MTIHKIESGQSDGTRNTIRKLVQKYSEHGVWLDRDVVMFERIAEDDTP